ncbi:MAG: peptide ABC transporter substrate-binding protein [Agarilytica sp.]
MNKIFPRAIAACAAFAALAACSPNNEIKISNEHALHISIGSSPQSIDPHVATGEPGIKILNGLCEPLLTLNTKTYLSEPGAAESWDISEDGLIYTFNIRKDARWSNGEKLTAHDFEYTWRRALLPDVGWQYAPDYYAIQGAEDYNLGKTDDFSAVGVKALDETTLQFTLAVPDAIFIKQLSGGTTCPVSKSELEKHGAMNDVTSRWTDAGKYVTNGPFKLIEWEINKILVAERNPYYWDNQNVKLDKVYFHPIETETSQERAFRSGQIQVSHSGRVPAEKIASYQENSPEKIKIVKAYATYFYLFNTTKAPFDNKDIRKALALSIDRNAIVENITKAGEKPASSLSILNETYHPKFNVTLYDPDQARKLLAKAGYPNGKNFPPITLIYNTAESHKKVALAIQQMWKKELGIDTLLENQEWKIFLSTRQELHFDISRAGSSSSIADPQDFLLSYTTGHGMNDTGWSNTEYDKLIRTAAKTVDTAKRFDILAQAEQLLLEEMPLIPLYYYSDSYLVAPSVKDLDLNAIGHINYKDIYIEKAE